jgi:type IV pilus assembly protein PilM
MDLKKEIKLSDLVKRPKRAKKPAPALQGSNGKQARSRPRKTKGELVGIKIGATQLAASRVANNGSPHVLQLAREDLPAGVVAGGEVRSVPALATALDEFFTKHGLPRRGVRLGVATNRIGVRAFEVAGIDDDAQLANAVRFRAHEAVGIPLDQAVLDYKVLSESVDGAGKRSRRILVVAAYRESIDRYTEAFREAGIELAGIDLEAFGLLRAVTPPSERPEGVEAAVVAVTIGHERTTLAISDGAVCDFTRVLEWGGSTLTSAIERQLNISSTEASELKLGLELDAGASFEHDGYDRAAQDREAVRRELQTLARELVASLQFYQGQPGSLAIGEILLSGGTSRMPGLPEELERLTRVKVRRADPLARAKVADSVTTGGDLASLAVAIGLGVED